MSTPNICPTCGSNLPTRAGSEAGTSVFPECAVCHSGAGPAVVANEVEVAPPSRSAIASRGIFEQLLYGISLPERVVRGAVGLTAGAARELADWVVPQAFQDSASYRVAIENSLGFLTETVGGIPRHDREAKGEEAGVTVARKAVGNFVDLAGLATLHVSPMWMLAVISDIAYGTQSYTQELARELAAQGVINEASTIHHVEDVLTAIRSGCGTAANTLDLPPLSIEELRKSIEQTRSSLAAADLRKLIPEAELRDYWQEMQAISRQENVSLLGVSGAIAMQTLQKARTAGTSTWIGLSVAGGVMNRTVLSHYRDSLRRIQDQGFFETVRASYGPYVNAVWENFSTGKKSWTEQLLDPAQALRLFRRATSLFSGGSPPTTSDSDTNGTAAPQAGARSEPGENAPEESGPETKETPPERPI